MAKYFLPSLILLLGLTLGLPMIASADFDDVQVTEDTNVYLTTQELTLTIVAGAKVEAMTVNPNNISFDLLDGSRVTVRSADKKVLTANPAIAQSGCAIGYSFITLKSKSEETETVTVTPGVNTCTPSGGGGGGAPAAPPTVPGEGTVTPSEGGTVSAASTEGGGVTVMVPPNAVVDDTTITITPIGTAQSLVGSPPAGSFMVGGYVYRISATSDGEAVTTFSAAVTLTFTYTDAQASGLDESTLVVYRWDTSTSQWVALPSTVNPATNTVTATTTQFSYFAIMGEAAAAEEEVAAPAVTAAQLKAQMIELIKQLIVLIAQLIAQLQAQLAAMQT